MKVKKNLIFLLVLLLFAVTLNSQTINKQIKITYKVSPRQHENDSLLTKEQSKFNQFVKKMDKVYYVLEYNGNESFFYEQKKMNLTDNKIDLVSILAGKGNFYYNIKLNISLNDKNFLGEDFIIKEKPSYEWILTQEKRKIGKYVCFKAKTEEEYINRLGEIKTKNIIVWYTLDIPIPVGVKNYHGLPGATITMKDDNLYYQVENIILNSKGINIKKPKKGKLITQKEYHEILSEKMNKRF